MPSYCFDMKVYWKKKCCIMIIHLNHVIIDIGDIYDMNKCLEANQP